MLFKRRKRILKKLESSFGQLKTEGFNFDHIKRYNVNKDNSSAFQELTEQTCNDLDFDLFFCFADRTTSKIGQQYLYHQLRTLDPNKTFDHQESVIKFIQQNPKERLKIQYQLNKLNHQQAYYITDLFQEEIEPKSKWYFFFPILTITVLLSIILSFINPSLLLIVLCLIPINVLIHYGLKRKTNVFLNSIPALLTTGSVAKKLSTYSILNDPNSSIDKSIDTISSIRRKMSFFRLEQKVDSDMEAAYWFLLEMIKITFLLEPLLLFSSLDKLKNKSKDIEEVYQFIGQVDSYLSIASLRSSIDSYCIPTIVQGVKHVEFENIMHPLLPNCVTNSIQSNSSVLLTGSNMSGKTTFIRAIGLNYISGMALNTCFASSASLPVAKLYSVIRIEDDMMSSSSYFYKEVDEIKKIILETDNQTPSIILLDELFKGTNTIERIASAKAVLTYLENQNCQVFVSTHDIELSELLKNTFDLFHFTESIKDSTIHFDYKLKKGVPAKGNAIMILEINNFPKAIVEEANTLIAEMK